MVCSIKNRTLYSGAGSFDLSNIVCTSCNNRIRVRGFLVYTDDKSGAYQISHRSGVLLHGTPFFITSFVPQFSVENTGLSGRSQSAASLG